MKKEKKRKSEILAEFLKFLQECESEYDCAFDEVGKEDKRTQDLLHEIEFAKNREERNKTATKIHKSRTWRRQCKDIVQENEQIVVYVRENKKFINGLKEALGRQRKEERYLFSERTYKQREKEEITETLEKKITAAFGKIDPYT